MNAITVIVLIFSGLGAIDHLLGNRFGIGGEFKRAFSLFCPMALSMLGMLVIAPAVGVWLQPVFDGFYAVFKLDPSIIPASLLANDMGGMTVAQSVCVSEQVGGFNAFVISSMMGCLISFTIPFSLGFVNKEQYSDLFFGVLCGVTTIPVGGFIGGLVCGIHPITLLLDLLPLIVLGVIVGLALFFARGICIKCFSVFGRIMQVISVIGLACAVFTFLTKIEISPDFDTLENAALVCVNACVTLSGALPFMFIMTKLLNKPLSRLGGRIGINGESTLAFLGALVTNATTFGMMSKMNRKGAVVNSAFAVSASFAFGGHLAFTMAYDQTYVLPMIVAKVSAGIFAVLLAMLIFKDGAKKESESE